MPAEPPERTSPDPSWLISALLTVGFFLGAASTQGALAFGWFVLAVGMAVVTYVRYRASHPTD